jgi:hypothetical protein
MTDRTSSQARDNLEKGHYSFKVLAATAGDRDSVHYVVTVPMAVMRSGLFGWVSQAVISTSGKPTKFGSDLFATTNLLAGVELSLENAHPHVVQVFTIDALEDTSPPPAHHVVKDMPAVICLAVEEAILRNSGFVQRFAEWLRRL